MSDSPARWRSETADASDEEDSEPIPEDDDVSLTYHRSGDGEQVLLGIESDGVRLSIAFDEETSRSTVEKALAAQRRELAHYYETVASR